MVKMQKYFRPSKWDEYGTRDMRTFISQLGHRNTRTGKKDRSTRRDPVDRTPPNPNVWILASLRSASPSGGSMLGGRAGLCWVGVAQFFLSRGPISSRTRFFEGIWGVCGYAGMEWVRTCARACMCACVRACVHARGCECVRA